MTYFHYQHQQLYVENVPLSKIAEKFGTPCYVYSLSQLRENYEHFDKALSLPHSICYAVKANSNIGLLNFLAKKGAGFDIVSLGELHRVLAAGGNPKKIVFSGVGKREEDIRHALEIGIQCFNVESENELSRITKIAQAMSTKAPISIRVNPNVDAKTHPYIATGLNMHKFGIDTQTALSLYSLAKKSPWLDIVGIDCHIGSQITEMEPFIAALHQVLALIDQLSEKGIHIHHLNLGGGLGIRYHQETPPDIQTYGETISTLLKDRELTLMIEPGRAMIANAGILLTRIEYIKSTQTKRFAIVDAGMNDLLRPSLYDAWHDIFPLTKHPNIPLQNYDVVGPVCESGDFFAKNRELIIQEHDLLAIMNAGAYGFSMSSQYNSRPRALEIAVENDHVHVIRDRESYSDLFKHEHLLP